MDTTVAKGFAVLEVLARARRPMRLSALTDALGFQKSNVHRLLATLIELGYVEKDPETSRYFASLKAWELGVAIISTNSLRRTVSPYLQKLHQATGDTVLLAVPVGHEVLFLDRVAPARALRYTPLNGTRAPMVSTAAGRVFLSAMDDPTLAVAKGLADLPPDRDFNSDGVMADLAEVRRRGLAMLDGGLLPGSRSVSAPIEGPGGAPVGAVSISAMAERMSGEHLQEASEALLAISNEIGVLGGD